jgi:hypothetical protein
MGYRNYVGKISNEKYEEGKDLTQEESEKLYGEDFWTARELDEFQELHNFGKYCQFEIEDHLEEFYTKNKNVYGDCEFHILSKEGFLKIIEWYRLKIYTYYKDLQSQTEKEKDAHFSSSVREWEGRFGMPFNLDEDKETVVVSWKYEYSVFELVRIFKTFDWENNKMVWYGY